MRAVSLIQEPAPLLVGERVNATGSRKIKRLLLAEDYDGVLAVAREQLDSGAHILDISVAMTERSDEVEQMKQVVKKLSMGIELPLMIDSTEADVIKAALEIYPGRAIVNSIHMEDGRGKIERVVPLLVEHGAAAVVLTIDESGMAKTADAQARSRAGDLRYRRQRIRSAPGRAPLRRADLPADDRRPRIRAIRRRDDRGDSRDQARVAGRADDPRRLEPLVRDLAGGARRPQLGLPLSRRRGRSRRGDHQSGARHALRRDRQRAARDDGRSGLQPPTGRPGPRDHLLRSAHPCRPRPRSPTRPRGSRPTRRSTTRSSTARRKGWRR